MGKGGSGSKGGCGCVTVGTTDGAGGTGNLALLLSGGLGLMAIRRRRRH
jgi:MYXO-CTERM domain-containing protein